MDSKITIGITCFNAEDTIAEAIESALNQTYDNFEIVIVDDCSTDHSIEVIQKIAEIEDRVRLIQHKVNSGVAVARNTIVERATGVYIAFFDDDDISFPERLEKQYQRIKAYEEKAETDLILCYADRTVLKPGEEKPSGYIKSVGRVEPEPSGTMVADYFLWNAGELNYTWGSMGSCVLMIKKSVFERIGFFDVNFRRCEDTELVIRAAFMGGHFIGVPEPLICQRITLTADKLNDIPILYSLMLRKKHKKYLKENGVYGASLLSAYAMWHVDRGNKWRARCYNIIAGLLSPRKVGVFFLSRAIRKRMVSKKHVGFK